ncbi:MAG: hypothetical protein M3Q69_19615, partial [Acidobacteriota bacterium]|nr:hypothetical protein [Acidobacteriota bacterium]
MNAGIGWTFTLGYIDKCSQDSVHPAYVSADGARHLFFNILNPEDVPANGVLYTRDGSYLRMTYPDAATTQIEFPDGGRHRFDARGRLTAMLDRFGNTVTVSYAPGPNCATDSADCAEDWTISDGFRQHKVDMRRISQSAQASSSGASQDLYSFDVVKSVKLSAGTTAEATYTFNYANNDSLTGVSRKLGPRQDCRVPAVILAVVLQNVTLPDGSRYDITTDTGDAAWDAVQGKWIGRFSMAGSGSGSIVGDQCDCPGGLTTTEQCTSPVTAIPGNTFSGHVTKVKRPTGATTEWNYGGYAFPPFVGDGNPCPPHKDITTCNFNVSDRSAVGVTERLEKATNAQGGETILSKRAYAHSFDSALPSVRTTISTYDNLNTSPAVASSSTYYYTTHFARLDTRKSEYGLPYTDLTSAVLPPTETSNPDSGGRYLSTKQFDAAGNLLGYTFVKYASDAQIDNVDESSVNRRVVSERKVQLDSSGTITNEVITDYSDFDGLGHHRVSTTTTGRNSSPTILRVVTTNYNKADSDVDASAFSSGTRPGGYVQFPSTSPWIVNTYSSQTATEDEKTARSLFLFNASTGFLHRRRTLKTIAAGSVAPAMSAVDTLAVFSQTSGNMTAEAYYGGDAPAQALSTTTPLNSLSVPSAAVYSATHSYSAGTLQTSQAVGVSFKFADRIVESATGRVTRSIDPAGVPTDFEYDKLGRLVWSLPTGGAATSYSYGLNPNMVTIQQYDGGKTAALLTRAQVDYDALGRVIREMRRMPNGSFSSRELTYNGRGLVESVTEWVASSSLSATTPRTTNTYDALGRLSTATAPDGSVTTYTYYGGRSVARQTSVATNRTSESLVTTTEVSDDLGRLYQVIEPDTTTTYGYDVTGHLSSVGMSNGATVQNRTFTYDGRGFLKTETHPESGTTNYEYDGRGHVIKRTAAGNTVAGFDYDAAERLKTVTSAGAVLKEFTFDRANSADGIDKSMGKMASATRHNPD